MENFISYDIKWAKFIESKFGRLTNLNTYKRNNILFLLAKRVQPEAGDNAKLAKVRRGHEELSVRKQQADTKLCTWNKGRVFLLG